jgi:hypothetical protein
VNFVFVKKHKTRSLATRDSRSKVINWNEYNRSLKERGSIKVWVNEQAIKHWYYHGKSQKGAQFQYSDMCIQMCAVIRCLYHLPLRQTEGFLTSFFQSALIGLKVPNYSVICRRLKTLVVDLGLTKEQMQKPIDVVFDTTGLKVYGEGEWKVRQHGYSKYRTWRKMHIAMDPETGLIHGEELTLNSCDDSTMVKPLLEQITNPINKALADGSYDTRKALDELHKRGVLPIIPPRKSARIKRRCTQEDSFFLRNDCIRTIRKYGRKKWKKLAGYHQRSKVETTMFRFKTILTEKLKSRTFERQQREVKIGCLILNMFTSSTFAAKN